MKKICLIVALLLALVDASAQWNWKENSSFGWRRNESSWRKNEIPWRNEHSWWNGFYGESTTFHKGKEIHDAYYTDRSSGTSYGFVGGYNNQVQRDYSGRRPYSAETGQWDGINAGDKNVARRNSGVWSESRPAGRAATRGNGRSLLNSDVWRTERHVAGGFNGGADATDYGRRVKPQGAPGNYNTPSAAGMKIGSKIKEMPVVGSDEESGRRTLGQENGGASGGQYGFGEVPKDDAPVGDGVLILLFFAALTGICKIYHQDFD